jgi:hypothetical protein
MAVAAGPDIVEDGLVLYYDLDNNVKSWKGEPTTNIISSQGITGMQNISYTYVGLENGWKKHAISGTWSSSTYPWSCRIPNAIFTGGVAYSSRLLSKISPSARAKFATWIDTNAGINYVNDSNLTPGTKTSTSLGYDPYDGLEITESKVQGFIYSTGYANPTTSQPGYLHSRPVSDGTSFDDTTDFVWTKEVQVEEKSYCTPYVDGTRSSSQSILDISGQNQTITIDDLSYSEDNTPTFDGINDRLSSITLDNPNGQLTCEVVMNYDAKSGYHNIFDRSASNPMFWIRPSSQSSVIELNTSSGLVSDSGYAGSIIVATAIYRSNTTPGLELYINGSLVKTNNTQQNAWPNPFTVTLFHRNNSETFQGKIYSLKFYDRALTANEVAQNFNAIKSRFGL